MCNSTSINFGFYFFGCLRVEYSLFKFLRCLLIFCFGFCWLGVSCRVWACGLSFHFTSTFYMYRINIFFSLLYNVNLVPLWAICQVSYQSWGFNSAKVSNPGRKALTEGLLGCSPADCQLNFHWGCKFVFFCFFFTRVASLVDEDSFVI